MSVQLISWFLVTFAHCWSHLVHLILNCRDKVNGHECLCAPGYAGAACEVNVDDCAPNPCANGGACRDGVDSFSCECTPSFMGETCQVRREWMSR